MWRKRLDRHTSNSARQTWSRWFIRHRRHWWVVWVIAFLANIAHGHRQPHCADTFDLYSPGSSAVFCHDRSLCHVEVDICALLCFTFVVRIRLPRGAVVRFTTWKSQTLLLQDQSVGCAGVKSHWMWRRWQRRSSEDDQVDLVFSMTGTPGLSWVVKLVLGQQNH